MIWIWLLLRHSQSWSTGPLSRYFTFVCAHCGASTEAAVQTFGYGSGRDIMAAQHAAYQAAYGNGYRAVSAAGCPSCGQLQPTTLAQFERAAKTAARRRTFRVPVALAIAVLVTAAIGVWAVQDLRHSPALAVVALATGAAIFGFFFAVFSLVVPAPSSHPHGVWFSRDPSQGTASWFPAQPGPAPLFEQPSAAARSMGFGAMAIGAITAIVALVVWGDSFRKIYVVNAQGQDGELVVQLDGVEVGRVPRTSAADAPYGQYEVRSGTHHTVTVIDPDGVRTNFELDPNTAKYGWAIAPRGHERGLCLASVRWYYGRKPPETNDDAILNVDDDLVALPRKFDHVFTEPPATVQVQNGSSETRDTLRAFDCDALERDETVPFKLAAPAKPSTL